MIQLRTACAVLILVLTLEPHGARGTEHADLEPSGQEAMIWRSERVCGLNCLYFLLRAGGKNLDYTRLRQALPSEKMSSLFDLKSAARTQGVELRLARLTPEELIKAPMPLIAHLDVTSYGGETSGHYVVVTHADKLGLRVVDGTTAESGEVDWPDFRREWSGYVAYIVVGGRDLGTREPILALLGGIVCSFALIRVSKKRRSIPISLGPASSR